MCMYFGFVINNIIFFLFVGCELNMVLDGLLQWVQGYCKVSIDYRKVVVIIVDLRNFKINSGREGILVNVKGNFIINIL